MKNGSFEKNISKKALSDEIWTDLKQLFKSNMLKVHIVKLSWKWIFVARSAFSGIPRFWEIAIFNANLRW